VCRDYLPGLPSFSRKVRQSMMFKTDSLGPGVSAKAEKQLKIEFGQDRKIFATSLAF